MGNDFGLYWFCFIICFFFFLHFNNPDNFDTKNGVQMNAVWEMILVCFDFDFVLFFFICFFFLGIGGGTIILIILIQKMECK